MSILTTGRNAWRVERAHRAAVLIDAAAYFRAVREALLQARQTVFIVGWDLDSRTRLVGESGEADDGWPATLREFLTRLVEERPQLTVHLLAWDYAVIYALEREPFPTVTLGLNTPRRVRFCLDDALPVGSSHHQKMIIIDDALAFSGGLDLTVRRWDTSEHRPDNPLRIDPSGQPYRPFHDVQMMVDGPAARALGELARSRWEIATQESDIPIRPHGTPWPASVTPDFRDADIAIARTQPAFDDIEEVREVETLFLDMVAQAERAIYVENQFLTNTRFAMALCERLQANPALEAVFVAPGTHDSWIESRTMWTGRLRFMRMLRESGVGERVRFLYPCVSHEDRSTNTMVHSKVMIVDDRMLRIGSANLNNRSMGTDTECDLAIEATREDERAAVRKVLHRLIADHCGVAVEQVAAALSAHGSIIRATKELSGRGHALCPIEDDQTELGELSGYLEGIADPERPLQSEVLMTRVFGERIAPRHRTTVIKLVAAALVLIGLTIAWHYPPLSAIAEPENVRPMLMSLAEEPWAPLLVIGVYLVAGLLAFPVLVLIAATAATFGPVTGFAYAAIGSLASAIVTYAVGAALGRETLRNVIGPRLSRIRAKIVRGGVLAVATIRLVPLAPFTIVNLVAGASEIRLGAYVAGTVLGMMPGLIVMSALGHQIMRIITNPSLSDFFMLLGALVLWVSVAIGIQVLLLKSGKPQS